MANNISVCHVNSTDLRGGAARAAYRIHRALCKTSPSTGIDSSFRCIHKYSTDPTVYGGLPFRSNRLIYKASSLINRLSRLNFDSSDKSSLFSTAFPDSGLGRELNLRYRQGHFNIVHLHWIGDHTISIEEISRLQMPLVWTFHDMWPFSGAEHYLDTQVALSLQTCGFRFNSHYSSSSRPPSESGFDICRGTWARKYRSWTRPIHVVSPSRWLSSSSLGSTLMHNWPTSVIPYAIDLDKWKPIAKHKAKDLLGLPPDSIALLFGADSGTDDPRKGGKLLSKALRLLSSTLADGTPPEIPIHLIIFGDSSSSNAFTSLPFPVHYLGRLSDDLSLRVSYSAADIFLLPSIQDNLPNTGIEAHACGTPVVAFDIGGMPDIVEDNITGLLVSPFSVKAYASALHKLILNPLLLREMSLAARDRACRSWGEEKIACQYNLLYRSL